MLRTFVVFAQSRVDEAAYPRRDTLWVIGEWRVRGRYNRILPLETAFC